jgi:hypothetical protein
MVPGSDETLRDVQRNHPEDGAVFIGLLAKSCLIASESGRFINHAIQAWRWYFTLVRLSKTNVLDDPEIFERLTQCLSSQQLTEAENQSADWLTSSRH